MNGAENMILMDLSSKGVTVMQVVGGFWTPESALVSWIILSLACLSKNVKALGASE